MDFQGFTYVAGDSPVHRCDARLKIIVLFAFSIAIFIVRTWWGMGVFVAGIAYLAALSRIPVRTMAVLLAPVAILAGFSLLFAVVHTPTVDGASSGLFLAVRMIALVAASLIVCLTTKPTALLAGLRAIMSPLQAVRVPVDDIALTLSLALRFIPVIADEFATVRKAQLARGAALEAMTFGRKLEVWGAAFSAVFIGLFRRADILSVALDARCYGAKRR